MIVTVKTLDSQSKTFTVPDEISVKEFKEHIASDVRVPSDRQRLIFKGKVLKDGSKLSECGVAGCVVHLVERKPPSQNDGGSRATASPNSGPSGNTTASLSMDSFQLPVDVMGVSQQIIQSLVNQLGADSAQANISTSASDDGSSLNVHINLQTTSQPGTLVNQRINRARRFLRDARHSLNRTEAEGIAPNPVDTDMDSPSARGPQANGSQGIPPADNTPGTLAQVFRETNNFLSEMQTALSRYIFLLDADSAEHLTPSEENLADNVAEAWHNLSHALHALSDLTFNFRAAAPRTVSLLSPLSPHGVPNVPLISSLLGAQQQPFTPRPPPQPRPAAAESAGAQTSDNPLRSNRNVRIRVDPQGGVAITSIIASLGRSGEAPTQNAQATQGVQTTTTTSGTRHSGDNGNGSRETFSSSFGNQRSSVSSGGAGTGTPAVGGGEAGETSDNPPPPPGSRTTRIIVDDFIALVSSIAPSPFTPTPPSASATPSSTAQGGPQGAGRGGGQSPAGAARFQLFNPTPPAAPPNHPDPTLPCQSFHFGPQSSQPRAQPDGSRDPASANTGGPAAAQSSSVASGPSPSAQRAGTTRDSAGSSSPGSGDGSPFQALFGLLSGLQGGPGAGGGPAAFLHQAFQSQQGSQGRRQGTGPARSPDQQIFGNLLANLMTGLAQDDGTASAQDPGARRTLGEVVRELQRSGVCPEDEDDGGLVSALLGRLSDVLVMQDIMGIALGSPEPFANMRPALREFVNADLLDGSEASAENLKRANERFVEEVVSSIHGSLVSIPCREGIDVIASVRSLLTFHCQQALSLILSSDDDREFARRFQELMRELSAGVFTLLAMCYPDGVEGVERIARDRLPQYSFMRDLDPGMRQMLVQMFCRNIRQMNDSHQHQQARLEAHLVRVHTATPNEAPTTQPPAVVSPPPDRDEDVEMGSDDSEGFSTPPASLQPDEPAEPADPAEEDKDLEWATIMPQDWVPVIARDIVRQRRHPPQAPFSDAYLSGMPAKKRRKVDQRGAAPTSEALPAALRQAVTAAGVTPRTSMQELNRAAQQNSDLHRAYRREVHRQVKTKLEHAPDYDPDRFPNTRDYFDKGFPEK